MDLAKLDCMPLNYKVAKICRRFNVNVGGKSRKVSRKEMQQKMAQNDINLFISDFDETSIMPLESLELGTICLVDNNSEYFRDKKKRAGDYDVACTLFPFIFFLYSSYSHAPNLALGNGAAK